MFNIMMGSARPALDFNKLASLGATLVRNYDPLTDLLTDRGRATSVAKKHPVFSENDA